MDDIDKLLVAARQNLRKCGYVGPAEMAAPAGGMSAGGMPAGGMPVGGMDAGGVDMAAQLAQAVPGLAQLAPAGPTPAQAGASASPDVDQQTAQDEDKKESKSKPSLEDVSQKLDELTSLVQQLLQMFGGAPPAIGQAVPDTEAAGPPGIGEIFGQAPVQGGMPVSASEGLAAIQKHALEILSNYEH